MKVSHATVRKYLRDEPASAHDIASEMMNASAIPTEEAVRSAPAGSSGSSGRILAGYVAMITPVLEAMATLDLIERSTEKGKPVYRLAGGGKKSRAKPRPIRIAADDEMTRPGPSSSGVTTAMLYKLVKDRPGITEDEILKALSPCWKPVEDLLKIYLSRSNTKNVVPHKASELSDDHIAHIRRQLLRHHIRDAYKLRSESVTKYYFVDGDGK